MELLILYWCFGLNLCFTLIYTVFGSYIFIRFKPKIAKIQLAIIILSFVSLLSKNIGFAIVVYYYKEYESKISSLISIIVGGVGMLSSTSFFISF